MEPIDVSFELNEDEFVEGQIGHFRRTKPKVRFNHWVYLAIIPALLIGLLYDNERLFSSYGASVVGVSLLVFLSAPLFARLDLKLKLKKLDRLTRSKYPAFECKQQRFVFDENGWQKTCKCGTDIRSWKAVDWVDEGRVVFAIMARNGGYTVPKRVFTADQMTGFTDLLQRRVTKRAT